MGMKRSKIYMGVALTMAAMWACMLMACNPSAPTSATTPGSASETSAVPASAPATAPAAAPAPGRLARIVYLWKSQACPCTADRCKKGDAALLIALQKFPQAPKVERLDVSTEAEKAQTLMAKHPAMILPVIYLFDAQDQKLEQLEGELTEAQVTEALARHLGGG
jgi:thiol:disulfide interchange protein